MFPEKKTSSLGQWEPVCRRKNCPHCLKRVVSDRKRGPFEDTYTVSLHTPQLAQAHVDAEHKTCVDLHTQIHMKDSSTAGIHNFVSSLFKASRRFCCMF